MKRRRNLVGCYLYCYDSFFVTISQLVLFLDFRLTYWSSHAGEHTQTFFLGFYGLINLIVVVAILCRLMFIMLLGLRASRKIYANLLVVIMHAPMSFFDVTPIGRIINRFGQDIYTVDSQLMTAARSYLTTILSVVSALVVNSGISPAFTIGILPLIYYYASQQRFFTVSILCFGYLKKSMNHNKSLCLTIQINQQ